MDPCVGDSKEDRRVWIRSPLELDGGLCKSRLPRGLWTRFLMGVRELVSRKNKEAVSRVL